MGRFINMPIIVSWFEIIKNFILKGFSVVSWEHKYNKFLKLITYIIVY